MLQLKKLPDIPVSSGEEARESRSHLEEPRFRLLDRDRDPFLRGRERIPGIPVASQEEALSTGTARGTPVSCQHSQSPQDVSVLSREHVFPALPRLSSRGSTHTTVARGTALWESLVEKPRGKASRESHRSLDPREGKGDTAATAREESARACPHLIPGLTPLGRLQKYPKIHVSTGEESSGYSTESTQDLRPRHRRVRNPERPRATRMGTGLS